MLTDMLSAFKMKRVLVEAMTKKERDLKTDCDDVK